MVSGVFKKVFGTKNDREVKAYAKKVDKVNALEKKYEKLSDDELKNAYLELKQDVMQKKKSLDDVIYDSFAITREVSKRTVGLRHFDVQIIGGFVLNEGRIAEMKTGEGKTLVATLPVVLNAMTGKGVHLVTVNDYLAKRDAHDMSPIYNFLDLSVGVLTSEIQDDKERKKQYDASVTYGTNNEYGFDYLRENMKYSLEEQVQRDYYFAIVDEVDSILIDEARTPLIISGPTDKTLDNYKKADVIAKQLKRATKIDEKGEIDQNSGDFVVDEKNKTITITEQGVQKAEKLFGIENMYSLENAILSHHLDQALKARNLFEKDVDYVVKDGEIVIVDEFTGRLSEGRRFSEGLHQALEAKENVKIQEESQTLADITFQNYFRLYEKLAGMTGTAQTEATEFSQIYNLDVISIPTNVPVARVDYNDLIYKTEMEKFQATVKTIKELHKKGQPVLVGTASIERSELLHELLKKEKIPHSVLNAKHHEQEAQIIKDAGKKGMVTIATNMAGRGVDIKINDEVKKLGGLFIMGTERHESRRIDNQLRGRSGRQGDPGNAQKKVENLHFESRKHLLEYDDVANEQRKTIYNFRNNLLDPKYDISSKLDEIRNEFISNILFRAEIFEGGVKEDYDLKKCCSIIAEELNENIDEEELKDLDYHAIVEKLSEILKDNYNIKMSVVDDEQRNEIERILYLQILDNAWREHLYQMDILKTGIGLRGYNQKDPLVEYKKESYTLFVELVDRIKFESFKTLHTVQLKDEEEELEKARMQEILDEMQISNEDMKLLHESSLEPDVNEPLKAVKKIPRNAPCPCGSGKKYKNCCGKSGPKKGIFSDAQV